MNTERRSRLKHQRKERAKFYLEVRKAKKQEFIFTEIKRRSANEQQGRLVTFLFNPDELGLSVHASLEAIEKLGLERAWERLDRRDFYKSVTVRTQGIPVPTFPNGKPKTKALGNLTKEHLVELRKQVLAQTIAKLNAPRLDLSSLTTASEETPNETVQD